MITHLPPMYKTLASLAHSHASDIQVPIEAQSIGTKKQMHTMCPSFSRGWSRTPSSRGEAHLSSTFPQEPDIAESQWAPATVLNAAGRNCVVLEKHRLRNPKTGQDDSSVAEQCGCSMEAASHYWPLMASSLLLRDVKTSSPFST